MQDRTCGGDWTIRPGQVREIISPQYPMNYPTNSKCTWKVSTTARNVISIQFIDFETEPTNDIVDVRDGPLTTSQLLARLSGAHQRKTFITTGSDLLVKFTSDHAIGRRGFKAIIRGGMCYSLLVLKVRRPWVTLFGKWV